jgi:membrane protease subunit HflC
MNRIVIAVIAGLIALYVLFSSMYVVNAREQAIVIRFGAIVDVKKDPGIYFKIPTDFIDTIQIVDGRLLRYDVANMRVQVQGGAFYEVDAFLTYRIADARKFRQFAQGDLRTVEARLATRSTTALRQVYGSRTFNAALSAQRQEMMTEAASLIRPEMDALGIEIKDVRILRTDLSAEVSEQTYNRMRAERQAEAALLRARGQEQAQSIQAIADRQRVELLAQAQRDADILRGEGDAQRNRIFADAYNADPEFFQFYRSMQSYRTALGSNGTTMVLSPDSEFFQYFANEGKGTPGKPLPAPETPVIEDAPPADLAPTDTPAATPSDLPAPQPVAPAADPVAPADATPVAPATETPVAPTDAAPAPAATDTQPAATTP